MSRNSPSQHRLRTDEAYNLHLINADDCDPEYLMPVLEVVTPEELNATDLRSVLDPGKPEYAAHFYLDDYRFERYWNTPEKYIDKLKEFGTVLTPDYSTYIDMPVPMQIWNVYRSRALGNYWQREGIQVIPTLQWAQPGTYEFALDGLPQGGVYSFSTVGVKESKAVIHMFRKGFDYAIEATQPKLLLGYGTKIDNLDTGGVDIIWSETDSTRRIAESQRRNPGKTKMKALGKTALLG